MSNFFTKLKNYGLIILAGISALLAAMFFYEKNKAEINDAILGEKKTDDILAKTDAKIDANNELLKQQEENRAKLEKEKPNEETNINTIVDTFNKLK